MSKKQQQFATLSAFCICMETKVEKGGMKMDGRRAEKLEAEGKLSFHR